MKKIIVIISLLLALVQNVFAQEYVSLGGGYSFNPSINQYTSAEFPISDSAFLAGYNRYETYIAKSKNNYLLSIAAGYRFQQPFLQKVIANTDLGISLIYTPYDVNGNRQEYQTYPDMPPAKALAQPPKFNYSINNYTAMIDYSINFKSFTHYLRPFLQLGIGLNYGQFDNYSSSENKTAFIDQDHYPNNSNTSFAYSVAVGFNFMLTQQWQITLGYRYLDMGSINSETGYSTDDNQIKRNLPMFHIQQRMSQIYSRIVFLF